MERDLDSFLKERSRAFLLFLSAALVLVIGLVDFVTGYDLSLSLFYLAPVSILAWYESEVTAYAAAFLSAAIWLLANTLAAPSHLTLPLAGWNTAIRLGFFVIVARLTTSLRVAHETQRELARTDALTGVYNSRTFRELVQVELLRADRMGYPVSLIYLDMDNFKSLNDQRGHGEGDALLQSIGRGLAARVRATDVVGRLGGDEFAVLLPNTDQEHASLVASSLQDVLAESTKGVEPQVSTSMGVVTTLSGAAEAEALISAGDRLMYEAKREGKNTIRHGRFNSEP